MRRKEKVNELKMMYKVNDNEIKEIKIWNPICKNDMILQRAESNTKKKNKQNISQQIMVILNLFELNNNFTILENW